MYDTYLKEFLQSLSLRGCSEKTIKGYNLVINNFFKGVSKDLKEINIRDIRGYFIGEKEKGNKESTIVTKINVIKSFFKWLTIEEVIISLALIKIQITLTD